MIYVSEASGLATAGSKLFLPINILESFIARQTALAYGKCRQVESPP